MNAECDAVTGAFGFTGKYIARRLLAAGRRVVTLTRRPADPESGGERISVRPLDFDQPEALVAALRGARTLYCTYWVRFPYGSTTFEQAVGNTQTLVRAAEQAGVRRVVHVSVANPDEQSPFAYFRGKALVEQVVRRANLSYAIIRPTVVFGDEDILINNMAWLLRRLPVFGVAGSGDYGIQPVFVEDLAELAVGAGTRDENLIFDAAGPEVFRYEDLVRLIAETVSSRAWIVHVSPRTALRVAGLIGRLVRDVVLTQAELEALMAGLLVSADPPTGRTRLSDWLRAHSQTVGRTYASELRRHYAGPDA